MINKGSLKERSNFISRELNIGQNVRYAEDIPFENVINEIKKWINICYD